MKLSFYFFSMLMLGFIYSQAVSAQVKKIVKTDSKPVQVKPGFSDMVDYDLPEHTDVYALPENNLRSSGQIINHDGSEKVSRTQEITVPAEKNNLIKTEQKTKAASRKQQKSRKVVR